MPTAPDGVVPVKLQTNLVPLYLPATTSPGPAHWPSTDLKNVWSRSAAARLPGTYAATATESGRKTESNARISEGTRLRKATRTTPPNLEEDWLILRLWRPR